MSRPMRKIIRDMDEDPPASTILERLLERLETAIGELGYEAVALDLVSDDLIGGDDSLLASDEVMVIPGHMDDDSRPILLAVTRGWNGKEALSFARVMRQVKARLTAGWGRSGTWSSSATPGTRPRSRRSTARSWRRIAAGRAVLVLDGRRPQPALRPDPGRVRPIHVVSGRPGAADLVDPTVRGLAGGRNGSPSPSAPRSPTIRPTDPTRPGPARRRPRPGRHRAPGPRRAAGRHPRRPGGSGRGTNAGRPPVGSGSG